MGAAGTALVQRTLGSQVPDRRPHKYGAGDVVGHQFDGHQLGAVTIIALDGWSVGWSQEPAYIVRTAGRLVKRVLEFDLEEIRGGPPGTRQRATDLTAAQVAKPNRSAETECSEVQPKRSPDDDVGTSARPAGFSSEPGWVFVPGCPLPLRWPVFAPVPRRYWQ